jgi:hypothetical protein
MPDVDPRSGADRAAESPVPPAAYGGKNLDPAPPPDHDEFVEARAAGLAAIRSRLAARRKKR